MPAKSKSQQRFFGIVHAIQKGDLPPSKAHGKARETAMKMDPEDVGHFAETKHKGLPKKVKSQTIIKRANLDCRSSLMLAYALMQ